MITYISPINMVAVDNHLYFAHKSPLGWWHCFLFAQMFNPGKQSFSVKAAKFSIESSSRNLESSSFWKILFRWGLRGAFGTVSEKSYLSVFVSTLVWIVGIGKLSQIRWFRFPVFTYFPSKCSIQIREWTERLKSGSFTILSISYSNQETFLVWEMRIHWLKTCNISSSIYSPLFVIFYWNFFLNKDWDKRNPAELKGDSTRRQDTQPRLK